MPPIDAQTPPRFIPVSSSMAERPLAWPGEMVGMIGGGQLGRMTLLAGRALGYRFRVWDPAPDCCAGPVADEVVTAPFDDPEALARFADGLRVTTLEFENIPGQTLRGLEHRGVVVAPSPEVVEICQHRAREKTFLREHGLPHVPFALASSPATLTEAIAAVGLPCVVKTAAFGYDGKGQRKLTLMPPAVDALWVELGRQPLVVEAWCPFFAECSIIVARRLSGEIACFPLTENIHRHHILHQSLAPARLPAGLQAEAEALARQLAQRLNLCGLLAVELFLTADGLAVNELAPRPHNSGHHTLESCHTSQFEQHLRAALNLPLGDPSLHRAAVMVNLLGDLWPTSATSAAAQRLPDDAPAARDRDHRSEPPPPLSQTTPPSLAQPDWAPIWAHPQAKLHLYDKGKPAPGRKMGHFTLTGPLPPPSSVAASDRSGSATMEPMTAEADRLWKQLNPPRPF